GVTAPTSARSHGITGRLRRLAHRQNASNNFQRTRGSRRRIFMKRNPLFLTTAFSRTALAVLALSLPGMIMSAATAIAERPQPAKPAQATPSPAGGAKTSSESHSDLSAVLAKMNQSAAGFTSAQGNFEFESYQKLMNDTDTQQGHIYFRRTKKGLD